MIWFIAPSLVLFAFALIRAIRKDGYGSRPPPASHHDSRGPQPYYATSSADVRIIA